jgi:relaxase-like protein
MSEFRTVRGFEEVWRPPVRLPAKRPEGRALTATRSDVRARLTRIAARVPEVMVKVTGRTRDPGHLAAHLTYVTRNGELPAEGRDGWEIAGRREMLDLARDWSVAQMAGSRNRRNSPFSVSLTLSMPAGTDALALRDASRQFAERAFGDRHDYAFVLHTDTGHPHVHLTVRALGDDGTRLNPKKADLEAWRQAFAEALRDRGIAAEATPRRARGVTRKHEGAALRKIRERAMAGRGEAGRVHRAALQEAGRAAFGADRSLRPWEQRIVQRQGRIRALYEAQARLLRLSSIAEDRQLGEAVMRFVHEMPAPDTQRLALARQLRAANGRQAAKSPQESREPGRAR